VRARRFFVSLVVVLTACTSATSSAAPSATGGSPAGSAPPSLDPSALIKGETFPVGGGLDLARYTTTERAQKASAVTIQIVAYQGAPAFEPTVIEASPGEMLKVTVAQNDDLSAHFQQTFRSPRLGSIRTSRRVPVTTSPSMSPCLNPGSLSSSANIISMSGTLGPSW
jgi:hypothetical protein